eukprot:SAG11_NODE_11107_length_783_cov_1.169591_1_plen_199_part_01
MIRLRRIGALHRHLLSMRYSTKVANAADGKDAEHKDADNSPFAQLDPSQYSIPTAVLKATPSPALFVFMDAVHHNISTMIGTHCKGDAMRWRPHLKTTKITPVYEALLSNGVRRFKCATPKEARVLLAAAHVNGIAGEVDLLVAYPHVEPNLSILAALASQYPESQLSVLHPCRLRHLQPSCCTSLTGGAYAALRCGAS